MQCLFFSYQVTEAVIPQIGISPENPCQKIEKTEAHASQRRNLSARKRCHTVLTTFQTTLHERLELAQ